jgi:hypothetical protein
MWKVAGGSGNRASALSSIAMMDILHMDRLVRARAADPLTRG